MRNTPNTHAEQAAAVLRENVAATLASVPNVAEHIQGIEFVIHGVIESRMAAEDHYEDSGLTRRTPQYLSVPGSERARIIPLINKAIEASGMKAYDAWKHVYPSLDEISAARAN